MFSKHLVETNNLTLNYEQTINLRYPDHKHTNSQDVLTIFRREVGPEARRTGRAGQTPCTTGDLVTGAADRGRWQGLFTAKAISRAAVIRRKGAVAKQPRLMAAAGRKPIGNRSESRIRNTARPVTHGQSLFIDRVNYFSFCSVMSGIL